MTPRDNAVTGGATKILSAPPSDDVHDVREARGMLRGLEQLGFDLDALLAAREVADAEGRRAPSRVSITASTAYG